MKLGQLAIASGVSSASIKFYLREGLLPPGRKKNATLAYYDSRHLDRLRLIAGLREIVGASLPQIRGLVVLIDDPAVPLPRMLQRAQLIGMGETPDGEEAGSDARRLVNEIVANRGWPDIPSEARKALARHLEGMHGMGLAVPEELLDAYGRAAHIAASVEIDRSVSQNRDVAALKVAIGVHSYTHLLLRMVALAQASLAVEHHRHLSDKRGGDVER